MTNKIFVNCGLSFRKYKCKICPQAFIQATPLKRHIRLQHSDERNYKCEICGRKYLQLYPLKRHQRTHSLSFSITCPYCTKTFKGPSGLRSHIGTHTRELRHPCRFCPKSFITSTAASFHRKRVHKESDGYKCRLCKTIFFPHIYMLTSHMRDEHNNAPFFV